MLTSLLPSQSQHSSGSLPFCTPGDNPVAGCEACGSCVAYGLGPRHPFETSHHSTPCKNILLLEADSCVQTIHPHLYELYIQCRVSHAASCHITSAMQSLNGPDMMTVTDRRTVSLAEHHHSAMLQHVHRPKTAKICPQQAYLQSSMAPPGIFSILTYFLMSISLWPPLTSDITHVTASSASSWRQQLL